MQLISWERSDLRRRAFAIGLAGLLLFAILVWVWPARVFPSYLMSYLFWIGLTLGCYPVLMIYHLVGGKWGLAVRPFLEAGLGTLPLMALLNLPIFFGLQRLYHWARPHEAMADRIARQREIYLNLPAFAVRTVLFFVLWGLLASLLLKWSRRQLLEENTDATLRLRAISGPGLVVFTLVTTFAYVDWVMALEPDWSSSIFPVIILIGQILCALAFGVVLLTVMRQRASEPMTREDFNHLGNLLLAFVMMWTYVSFSQLLIVYAGNLPHEIHWYLHRMRGGWIWVALVLLVFQFFVPFIFLLFKSIKRSGSSLGWLSAAMLVVQVIAVFWYVGPTFRPTVSVDWLDPIGFAGIGGAWLAAFTRELDRQPTVGTPPYPKHSG